MDETDEFVDVHKRYINFLEFCCMLLCSLRRLNQPVFGFLRIRVAAAAAASSVARAPSIRRLTAIAVRSLSFFAIINLVCIFCSLLVMTLLSSAWFNL